MVTGTGAGGCYCSRSMAEGAVAAGGGDQTAHERENREARRAVVQESPELPPGVLLVAGTGAGGCYCSHSAAEGAVAAGGGDQRETLAGAAGLLPQRSGGGRPEAEASNYNKPGVLPSLISGTAAGPPLFLTSAPCAAVQAQRPEPIH